MTTGPKAGDCGERGSRLNAYSPRGIGRKARGFWLTPSTGNTIGTPAKRRTVGAARNRSPPFPYAVLESDQHPAEVWLPVWSKILVQLPLPIVSIVSSGGKSLHALVRVSAASKAHWDEIKLEQLRPLAVLGADDAALSAVRLTHLPQCWRWPRRQELLYLNPNANGSPIYE
jgi:hypothetical protein